MNVTVKSTAFRRENDNEAAELNLFDFFFFPYEIFFYFHSRKRYNKN